jgi:putative oxidoreductase
MENLDIIFFLGRVFFGAYFLNSAYVHLFKTDNLAGYAASKGVPQPKLAVIVTGLMLFFSAYTIIAGVRVSWGVGVLALFLIAVNLKIHTFWSEEGEAREGDKSSFLRNVALLGAALCLLAIPTPWPISLAS